MTPAARAQAAIECLDRIRASVIGKGPPADALLRDYFAARRYAGSKDRAAIGELVFAGLRRWRDLGWRMMGVDRGLADGRMAILALLQEKAVDDLHAVFSGGYGPAPLTAEEQAALEAVPPPMPTAVALNIPDWLEPALRQRFGVHFDAECRALNARAPLDLRVNTLKANRATIRQVLEGLGLIVRDARWSPLGLRLPAGTALGNLPPYKHGEIEVQDEASQFAALLTFARPGETVVDLCAGAGGKTLALAADMENRGRLCAFDIRQSDDLRQRAERAGVSILDFQVLPRQGARRSDRLGQWAGRADRVLVDAPCSGTGTWRRAPDAKWRLAADHVARHVETQAALLSEAAALVKPGGRLVYATCSLLAEENEQQIEAFINRCSDFTIVPYRAVCVERAIIPPPSLASDDRLLQFAPGTHGTDGFFVTVMEKDKK